MKVKQKVDEILAERKKCKIRDLEKLEQLFIETIWECDKFDEISNVYYALHSAHTELLDLKK